MNRPHDKGFTLMEVAIIVVIVSILTAIAIPQFRTAEIKSKVSVVYGQLNVISNALEAYYTDNFAYPSTPYSEPSVPDKAEDGNTSRTSYYTLRPLTTPISYLARIPEDPFADNKIGATFDDGYRRFGRVNAGYGYRHAKGSQFLTFPYYKEYDQDWVLSSVGPDRDYDIWGTGPDNLVFYDPTNGIDSNGDIVRLQRVVR
jgi:prepilin-type N-terminal cleavage/methylation domain-containing protein